MKLDVNRLHELHSEGHSMASMAAQLVCCERTIRRNLNKLGLFIPKQQAVATKADKPLSEFHAQIAKGFRIHRTKLRMDQETFARTYRIPLRRLRMIERGVVELKIGDIYNIATRLGISPITLMEAKH